MYAASRMSDKRDRLKAASEVLLGDEDERADGEAAFEKWSQAQRVRKTERAYPLGCNVQQPRRIDAPSASFKLEPDAVLDQHQEAIKSFVQVRVVLDRTIQIHDLNCPAGWGGLGYKCLGSGSSGRD